MYFILLIYKKVITKINMNGNISEEILLFQSFARLLYNSYRIINEYKEQEDNLNYYENANEIFKSIIEDDLNLIKHYNKCCFILFGNDENFCGRFSIKYLKKSIKIIKKHYNEFVNYLTDDDELFDFFTYIFEPVLNNMYDEYIEDLKNENERKLKSFISSDILENNDCSICMESIYKPDLKIIKFDCNHIFHYDCIFNWFMEKQCCPICRKEF